MSKTPLLTIDLFSGAGGFHLGFEKAGFSIALCVDNNEQVEKTHKYNFPKIPFIRGDIRNLTEEDIYNVIGSQEIDLIIGGPPCQGFSTIGKRVSSNLEKREKHDPRNELVIVYANLIKKIKPKYIVMENVKGILTKDKGVYLKTILDELRKAGYEAEFRLINMADFGVPQIRERVIIIGNRLGKKNTFPEPDHSKTGEAGKKLWQNCWDVIKDLAHIDENKDINHVPLRHTPQIIERYKLIPEGGRLPEDKLPPEIYRKNFGSTYKRLSCDRPALTMVPGNDAFPIHPILNRSLTVREAARIQTFSDEIIFSGNRRQQGHQVGNAVPMLFSEKLAKHILKIINE